MFSRKRSIGNLGEDIACEFLVNKKHKILTRNYWKPWGEIDIVSRAPDGALVFVEVKTMAQEGESLLKPEDQADPVKMRKVRKTCEAFARTNPHLINVKRGWRIDLIAIVMREGDPVIRHYENV